MVLSTSGNVAMWSLYSSIWSVICRNVVVALDMEAVNFSICSCRSEEPISSSVVELTSLSWEALLSVSSNFSLQTSFLIDR